MKESVLGFTCEGEPLVGILAEPDGTPADVGVLIIVGGPQYRAGSHRQFTLLARQLASDGFAALRFDYRGMGDSGGEARDFEGVDTDIAAAIDALLAARPVLKRVALWGLCDAASAALLYVQATGDPRVAGLCLLNPWVRSAATLAQTHVKHYYWRRMREKGFWLKLLRGGVGLAALRGLGSNLRLARGAGRGAGTTLAFQERMAVGLDGFAGPALLMLSGDDYTAQEFIEYSRSSAAWAAALQRPHLLTTPLPGADHTLSSARHRETAETHTLTWLKNICRSD
ncbi:MAG TPA: hydrolase 1, exosortase A system-associated [Roseateles sp.]